MLKVKRVYDKPERSDGTRILVDRLWPRGLTKERAKVDVWLKDASPSTDLRKWFGHDESRWGAFKKKYSKELENADEPVTFIRSQERKGTVTLLFSAHDPLHNNAVALKEHLERRATEA